MSGDPQATWELQQEKLRDSLFCCDEPDDSNNGWGESPDDSTDTEPETEEDLSYFKIRLFATTAQPTGENI